ncbi:phospholipase A [Ramlibacter humi]|uniref:Phospholipase A1 n=1 Tax=Ramlibacter humi TaxID=2530451 RepID=A0A4Z0BGB9_9BURK|nr:phospholipase A [Ramlibacter humi]TFY98352.1 phospholipase [Ramlibacter humi]
MPFPRRLSRSLFAAALLTSAGALHAQTDPWQACTALDDPQARLACYDRWAAAQREAAQQAASPATPSAAPPVDAGAAKAVREALAATRGGGLRLTRKQGCHNPELTGLSAAWELEDTSDCGTFGLRGYRPTSIAVVASDSVNKQPTSPNPLNNAAAPQPYRNTETRLQLSVRTKLATGLLPVRDPTLNDSLWFGYTQQSYWQLFTPAISRPFRSTDHEPELFYLYPLQAADASRWRLRFGGIGISHQSNGQSLPLSRSWNRVYLMAGAERGDVVVQARVWQRIHESAANDDNPNISSFIGRAEGVVNWRANLDNQLRLTVRHNLQRDARGSVRLEWFHTLAGSGGEGLQLHTQLFSGYGDSLLDYNRRRTMLSIGLSLSDW